MSERLSRKELYDLVWSEPLMTLSARFGISDVAVKKTCARAQIPTPERGYWAKKDAGKETFQAEFPVRPPGMNDEVEIGAGASASYHYWTQEEILAPIGAPPQFPESIESVRERIMGAVGHVTVPKTLSIWHPTIDRLLKEDEERRQKQLNATYTFSWEAPRFDSPLARRRLRILNSLFFAVGKMNGRPACLAAKNWTLGFRFSNSIFVSLWTKQKDQIEVQKLLKRGEQSSQDQLCLSIFKGWGSKAAVRDVAGR